MSELPITLVFASDDGYAPYLCVAMASALEHIPAGRKAVMVLLDNGISAFWMSRIRSVVARHDAAELRLVDALRLNDMVEQLFRRRGRKGRVTSRSYSTYHRLFLPGILPDVKRCAYVDVDILVCRDLTAFFDADLHGAPVGVVTDVCLTRGEDCRLLRRNMAADGFDMERYFNAGIMLIDLEQWRERRSEVALQELFVSLPNLIYSDQDILNAAFAASACYLDDCWNFLTPRLDVRTAVAALPGIIHYAGVKPWRDPVAVPLAAEWWGAARRYGLDADIAAHEARLLRRYLAAKVESRRRCSLQVQVMVALLKCRFLWGAARERQRARLERLRAKLAAARAASGQRL